VPHGSGLIRRVSAACRGVDVGNGAAVDRHRLQSLRYAAGDEAEQHIAIMRAFTASTSGLLSDLSAAEVLERLPGEHAPLP
jgi:hypothetical protein